MKPKNREKYPTRTILITNDSAKNIAILAIRNAPLDAINPISVTISEQIKKRSGDANSRMWAGPLKDISEQAYMDGRTFKDVLWHEQFKELFLPDEHNISIEELSELVLKPAEYKKYDYKPKGGRILVGSSTELTRRGFYLYLEQIYAEGANMGVQFSMSPSEVARYG